jgi:hypothetical protein
MKRVFWMAMLLVMLFVGVASADPFLGVWKMETNEKSGFKSQVITVTATDTGHKWAYDITLGNGTKMQLALLTNIKTGEVTLQSADGKALGTGHFKKTGDAAWEVETPNHKSKGSIVGKKMTINQTVPSVVTIVFDKQ